MTPDLPYTPSLEELAELYLRLKARVERMEGMVQQLVAEGKHDTLTRPTWRDVETIRQDIARLEKMLSSRHRPRRLAGDKGKA
jgi:hypothetical protein